MADGQPQMQDCYEKDPNIVSRLIEDEYILVPIRQNTADLQAIFTLEGMGVRIWELMDGTRTLADIKATILEEYEVDPETAEADLLEFVGELESVGGARRV